MPNATGYLTTTDVKRIVAMRESGVAILRIAETIGCSESAVSKLTRRMGVLRPRREIDLTHRRARAARYARMVELASAYVPTFGGGR